MCVFVHVSVRAQVCMCACLYARVLVFVHVSAADEWLGLNRLDGPGRQVFIL